MSRPSKQMLLFLSVYWNLCNATSEFSDIQWHLTKIYGPKVFLLTKKNSEYSQHPVQSDTFPWSLGVSDWTGFTVLNKMNCELMLTYDTPAYMFNVYKSNYHMITTTTASRYIEHDRQRRYIISVLLSVQNNITENTHPLL